MPTTLSFQEMFTRLALALGAGILIGLERESHGRAAGLRTMILACTASALAMILSEILFTQSIAPNVNWRPDPARLAAGILTGIGFLGGGTILRHDNAIRGVTTAASLWFVTVLGLVFGGGQIILGLAGVVIAVATLFILRGFEKHISRDWYAKLTVTMKLDAMSDTQLKERLESLGARVKAMELSYDLVKNEKSATCELKLKKPGVFQLSSKIVAALSQQPGILFVNWT